MSGWIRIWRKSRENFLWRQRRRFSKFEAWLDLLLGAAYRDHELLVGSRLCMVKRGQVLLSARKKAQEWHWARGTVLDFFLLLERQQMVCREVSHGPEGGYTLLSILNYERYQGSAEDIDTEDLGHGMGHELSHARATVGPRTDPNQEGREGKETPSASGLTLDQYLEKLPPENQEVLRQTVSAIATTRKSGEVAQSVLNSMVRKFSRYPQAVVLQACRVYLAKDYAGQGRDEQYLLGIVRGEVKRQNGKKATPENVNPPASVYDDPRWPHVWACAKCGGAHEGTKAQRGTCPKTMEEHGARHA